MTADGPVIEAGIAGHSACNNDVLGSSHASNAIAEQAAVDDSVVVPDLRVGPVPSRREVGQPEMLIAQPAVQAVVSSNWPPLRKTASVITPSATWLPLPNSPGLFRLLPPAYADAPWP